MIALSHALRRSFVKDCDLPIQILHDPYFGYLLTLLDPMFREQGGVVARFNEFCQCVNDLGGEKAYFAHNDALKDKVLNHVQGKPDFVEFSQGTQLDDHKRASYMETYKVPANFRKDFSLFRPENAGDTFVSIDLVTGNFRALRTFAPSIVDSKNNYAEFIAQFTPYNHLRNSKHLRQYLFGNLNPKRQIHIEKWLLWQITEALGDLAGNIVASSHDEVVLSVDDKDLYRIDQALSPLAEKYDLPGFPLVRKTQFSLIQIEGTEFYVRRFYAGGFDFKCVPDYLFPQVFKHYMGLPIEEFDLTFYHDGRIARFLEPYFEQKKGV